jgi:hypothetical protein
MKIILVGYTGFVGGEILQHAIDNAVIRSIICITDSPEEHPTQVTSKKIEVVVLQSYKDYPVVYLLQLYGAECCIWFAALITLKCLLLT